MARRLCSGRRMSRSCSAAIVVAVVAATAAADDAVASTDVQAAAAPELRRLGFGFGGELIADAGNPTMSKKMPLPGLVLPGMAQIRAAGNNGEVPMLTPEQERWAKDESSQFIGAMVKSFLNKQELQPGELDCITEGSKTIGGKVGTIASSLGMILEQIFDTHIPGVPEDAKAPRSDAPQSNGDEEGAVTIQNMINRITRQQGQQPARSNGADTGAGGNGEDSDPSLSFFYDSERRLYAAPDSTSSGGVVGAVPLAMELGINMKKIVEQTHELVGKCVHSDARDAFRQAGDHMKDLNYMTGHFLANGADIVREFADSVLAYQHNDPARFGSDVGIALRKVFLSNNIGGKLPEGMPGDAELANVTAGLVRGFFGEGTQMNIMFQKDPSNPVHVDMHACVGENVGFFQQIWASTMYLFAQTAVGAEPTGTGRSDGMELGTMLAFTLMELPHALDKCHISPEQKAMLIDSLKAMGKGMHMKFSLPTQDATKKAVTSDFAQTVKAWSAHHWYEFGLGLGDTMRKATIAYFPKKYSMSDDGALIRELAPSSSAPSTASSILVASLFVMLGSLIAFAMLRRWASTVAQLVDSSGLSTDVEEGLVSFVE